MIVNKPQQSAPITEQPTPVSEGTEINETVQNSEPIEPPGPKKTFNKERAYDFLQNLNKEYGSHLSEKRIAGYSNEKINNRWFSIYRSMGAPQLEEEQLDSIYDSFFDVESPAEVMSPQENGEKKKTTVSRSILEQRQLSSESARENNEVDYERIKNTPAPKVDGSQRSKIEYKNWAAEQSMLEDAERDFGENFYLKEFETYETSKFDGGGLNTPFQESASLGDYISKSDMSWFNKSEKDAEAQFIAQYGMMGFTAKESGFGKNKLIITSPDGKSEKSIRLFTEDYKRYAGVVGDEVYREKYHLNEIENWMTSQVKGTGIIETLLRGQPREKVLGAVQGAMSWGSMIPDEDFKYMSSVFSNQDLASMNSGSTFKPEKASYLITNKIQQLNAELNDLPVQNTPKSTGSMGRFNVGASTGDYSQIKMRKGMIAKLGEINDGIRASAKRQSAVMGAAMLQTGAYKQFDFAGSDADMLVMTSMGMDARDIPFDELTVNGRPSTYAEINNLLTDYDGVRDIREGKISIGINTEGVTSQAAQDLFGDLQKIVDRNNAVRSMGALGNDSAIGHLLTNSGLNLADFGQNLALSTLDVISQIQYANHDAAKALGVPDDIAQMAFGVSSVLNPLPMMHPSHIKHLKEEYLPLYNTGITDAESFGEFMAKGSDALAQSLPTSAVFMANPVAGLSVIGVSAYGRELYQLDSDIAEAQKQVEEGGFSNKLSELRAQRLATMSRAEARGIALSVAGIETAVTRVFTYNFFKNAAAAKNFGGVKNETNAGKLSNAYQKIYYRNFIENTAYKLGVSKEALFTEIPEEEIIAATTYGVKVAWGLQEYDAEEFKNLLKETGVNSVFSSVGMARIAQTSHNSKVNKTVDDFVKRNIRLPEESSVADQHLRATQALEKEKNPRQRPLPFDSDQRYIRVDEDANAEIQERGALAKPVQPNQDNIDMLEQVVDETGAQLRQFNERKQELVDRMSKTDKKAFLDAMSDIERYQSALYNATEGAVGVTSMAKINAAQKRARELMLKYPSRISLNYLPANMQEDYKQRAVDAIIEERGLDKDNITYEITTTDGLDPYMLVPYGDMQGESENDISKEDIDAKAADIYMSESQSDAVKAADGTLVLPGFNYMDAERMLPVVSKEQRDKFNLRSELQTVLNMRNEGTIDFNKPVETKRKTDELQAEEVLDFTKGQLPVSESTVEEDVALDSELDAKIVNKEEVVQEEMKTGLVIRNSITEDSRSNDQERIDNVLGKLDFYDKEVSDFMSLYLDARQQSDVIEFFSDVKSGKRGNIGKVESILGAVDIAVDIASQMPEKISILQKNGENPVMQALVNLSQQLYDGNTLTGGATLATTTVLMQSLIKDQKIGKPFYDLNDEAGRVTDEVKQMVSKVKDEHLTAYQSDLLNDEDYQNASKLKRAELANPNSLLNSYEMYALSFMYRKSGDNNLANQDTEFARAKSLILQELKIREDAYKAMPDNEAFKGQFFQWKQVIEKLGVKDANSYEDIRANATSRNANAIDRIAEAQPNEAALQRIQDYNRFEPKVLSRYLPTFYKVEDGGGYVDAFGVDEYDSNGMKTSNQSKDVTMPESLGGENNLRLNPDMFYDQIYGSLQGLEMDIRGRGTYRTLSNLMNSPAFQELFEGNVRNDAGKVITSEEYNVMKDIFLARESTFDNDIQYSHRNTLGYGEVQTTINQVLNSALSAGYSFSSAVSLGRITQNLSQYQSAVAGVTPMLESSEALGYLRKKNVNFYLGHSNILNGNTSKSKLSKVIQGVYGNKAYAANIYGQSRTGLRNSLSSELIVNQNKKYPLSYYLRQYNLVDVDVESNEQGLLNEAPVGTDIVKQETLPVPAEQKKLPPKEQRLIDGESANVAPTKQQMEEELEKINPTQDKSENSRNEAEVLKRFESYGLPMDGLFYAKEFFDAVAKSNSASLEILLAAGDRAAANATFESLYLDYRLRQGVEFTDNKSFWESENANPNKEAINYADRIIDETQTQTTSTSQAGIYSEYASNSMQNAARLIIPFSRFNMNARSAITNKLAVLNDPTIDESQKRDARKFIQGKVREVAFFRATAVLGWTGIATGTSGILAAIGAVEKEDIERYGGITGLIGDKVLPIEDRDIIDIPKGAYVNAKSVEEMQVVRRQIELAMGGLTQDMADMKKILMTYENKFTLTSYNPELLRDVTQDVVQTINPIPRPTIADDAMSMLFNASMEALGVPVEANEFLSYDLKGTNTSEGVISILSQNAGMASIGIQQYDNLKRAFTLQKQGKIFKYNPMTPSGEIPVAVSALSPEMREQLSTATDLLLYLRVGNIFIPGIPKADVNKFAGRLERQIETMFDAVLTDSEGNPLNEFDINFEESAQDETTPERKSVLD